MGLNTQKESSSYKTFNGTVETLVNTNPLWFILENVDVGDATDEQSNGAVISQVLADAGFETRNLAQFLFYGIITITNV